MKFIPTKSKLAIVAASVLSVAVGSVVVYQLADDASTPQKAASGGGQTDATVYRPVEFEAHRAFPMETLTDVALRADAVALGTPVAETQVEDPEVIERGEGYLGRRITVQIDRMLWQRPGVPAPSGTIETGGGSWRYSSGTRTPFISFGDVGTQYLFVLDHNTDPADTNGYEWKHEMTLGVPMIGGRTPAVIQSDKPFLRAIEGKSPEELAKLFASSLRR